MTALLILLIWLTIDVAFVDLMLWRAIRRERGR